MALDTLYAEGQRRYIESFSAYTRQFLEQLDKPQAERIDGIPPAIAVTHKNPQPLESRDGRHDDRGERLSQPAVCPRGRSHLLQCGQPVRRDSPESAAETLAALPAGVRLDGRLRDGGARR